MNEERLIGKEPIISKIFKLIRKFTVGIIEIVLICIIFFNVYDSLNRYVFHNESAGIFGYKFYTIISGSMEPTICVEDFILIKKVNPESLRKGDIISFNQGDQVVTHRIVGIESKNEKLYFVTKGDNNNTEDSGSVSEDMIEGKFIKIVPFLGKISIFLQTLSGKLFLIAVPIILILIEYLKAVNKKYQETERHLKRLKYNASKEKNYEI